MSIILAIYPVTLSAAVAEPVSILQYLDLLLTKLVLSIAEASAYLFSSAIPVTAEYAAAFP